MTIKTSTAKPSPKAAAIINSLRLVQSTPTTKIKKGKKR